MSATDSTQQNQWSPFVPTIDEQNPWPGLSSYPQRAAPFFHGREEEILELLRLVRRDDLAVVHGKSGVGKTSLLQAGFIPLLEADDCMPVLIRLDHSPESAPLVDQVKFAIGQAMLQLHVDGPIADEKQTLWEYFHRRGGQFWGSRNRLLTPVLIFRQFEEIFSLGYATDETRLRSNDFLAQLIDLIDNRQPLEVRRLLLADASESSDWNFEESGCKLVLCLRKEWVTDLDGLNLRALSDEKRLALGMLRGDIAVEAVARSGVAVLDQETAERIVRFIADGGMTLAAAANPPVDAGPVSSAATESVYARPLERLEVEPALLSLICRELNADRQRRQQDHIDPDQLVGTPSQMLASFYERAVKDAPLAVRLFVEDRLVTKFGSRRAIALDDALAVAGVTPGAIRTLVDRQLLHVDDRLGITRLELSHDVLIEPVRASREARIAREEEQLRRDFAAKMRRTRIGIAIGVVVCVLAIGSLLGLIVIGWHERDRQAGRAARAEQKLSISEEAKAEAEKGRLAAETARDQFVQAQKAAVQEAQASAKASVDAALAAKSQAEHAADLSRQQIQAALESRNKLQLSAAAAEALAGDALAQSGKPDDARDAYLKEMEMSSLDPDAAAAPPVRRSAADANDKLGNLSVASNDLPAAQRYFEAAQAFFRGLIQSDPSDLESRRRTLAIDRKLSDVLLAGKQPTLARLWMDDGLNSARKLLQLAPTDAFALRGDAFFATALGELNLTTTDGASSARELFAEAVKSWNALRVANAAEPQAASQLLKLYQRLGDLCLAANDAAAAVQWYSQGLDLSKSASDSDKDSAQWNDSATFLHGLGMGRLMLKDLAAARDALTQETALRITRAKSDDADLRRRLWENYRLLADICRQQHDMTASRQYLEKRIALASNPPSAEQLAELPEMYLLLGRACLQSDAPDAAQAAFLAGLKFDARNPAMRRGLADVYVRIGEGKLKGRQLLLGRQSLELAAKIYSELNAANPRDADLRRSTLGVYQQLGDLALRSGDAKSSRAIYEKYAAIAEAARTLTAGDAPDPDLTESLLTGYEGLGDACFEMGDVPVTKDCFEKYRKVIESLPVDKDSALARHSLAVAYGKLGGFSEKLDVAEARRYFQQEIKALDELPPSEMEKLESQSDLSQGLGRLASICMDKMNDLPAAVAAYQRAVQVDEALFKAHPTIPDLRRDASASNTGLGDAVLRQSGADAAKKYFLRGLELAQAAVDAEADSVESKLVLARSLRQCGYMSLELKDLIAAREHYERALSIDQALSANTPDSLDVQLGLARDLIGAGDVARASSDEKAAVASFTRAREIIATLRSAGRTAAVRRADELAKLIDPRLKGARG